MTTPQLRVLDLFSGIGGFSLGLERTGGFKTVAFCEIDNYCQRVLHKHWPEVYIHSDIRTLTSKHWDDFGYPRPDVICGGFPCQDISLAGKGAGISEGTRSGLWSEYARLIGELRPKFAIVENVAALRNRGLDRVLCDLAALGYDAEWSCIPASAVGAPHRRDRLWIVAYPTEQSQREPSNEAHSVTAGGETRNVPRGSGEDVADAERQRQPRPRVFIQPSDPAANSEGQAGNALDVRFGGQWSAEPNVGRVAHGVPKRVDRLKCLGNAVVPQIPEWIGRRILTTQYNLTTSHDNCHTNWSGVLDV